MRTETATEVVKAIGRAEPDAVNDVVRLRDAVRFLRRDAEQIRHDHTSHHAVRDERDAPMRQRMQPIEQRLHTHEHVLEILGEAHVIDADSTLALYRRIAIGPCGQGLSEACETNEALRIESLVNHELARHTR